MGEAGTWVAALRDEAREALFKREAALVARLQDAGIVTLFDFGTHDGRPYLVFELLQGETLQDRVERGPLPVREALRIAVAIARALGRAHHAGVLHRDLKPILETASALPPAHADS